MHLLRHMLFASYLTAPCLAAVIDSRTAPLAANGTGRNEPTSVCKSYAVGYENGGTYFVNTASNASFELSAKFDGCNDDFADVMLVNQNTSDQYSCGQVHTVPDNVTQTATCQIPDNQITAGQWLVILIGNNGNGNPFSFQREFRLETGSQQTTTVTPTSTFVTSTTVTSNTTTATLHINSTTTVSSISTITSASSTYWIESTQPITTITEIITSTMTGTVTGTTFEEEAYVEEEEEEEYDEVYVETIIQRDALATPKRTYNLFHHSGHKPKTITANALDHPVSSSRGMSALRTSMIYYPSSLDLEKRAPAAPTVTTTASVVVATSVHTVFVNATLTTSGINNQTVYTSLPPTTVWLGNTTMTTIRRSGTKTFTTWVQEKVTATVGESGCEDECSDT